MDLKPDGSFRLNMDYFGYCHTMVMTTRKFERLFGGPPRRPEAPLTQREMDIAASIQAVTEEAMLRAARHVHQQTGMKNLCLAGGVALNCVANGRILRETPFENIWIQPAAGDAGGALGAALFVWYQLLDNERQVDGHDRQQASLLGPAYSDDQIRRFLDSVGRPLLRVQRRVGLDRQSRRVDRRGQGHRMGPGTDGVRAAGLGQPEHHRRRAEPGNAVDHESQDQVPRVLPPVRALRAAGGRGGVLRDPAAGGQSLHAPRGRRAGAEATRRAGEFRSLCRASTSSRPNAASSRPSRTWTTPRGFRRWTPQRHPRLHKLIAAFKQRTGCPVIINTSFNIRGEPIVCSPQDAYRCFMATNMDVLVLENQILYKQEQPQAKQHEIDEYKARFELD